MALDKPEKKNKPSGKYTYNNSFQHDVIEKKAECWESRDIGSISDNDKHWLCNPGQVVNLSGPQL